jgi:uncharacterized repeat protein (TIGR01451 family)
MRLRRWFPTVAVFSAAAVALMILAGAGSAARTPAPAKSLRAGITLGSVGTGPAAMVKIERYLRSVGIDPRTVTIQVGKRNYAGPKCPGKRWTCTTATRVLQAGSDNVFTCSGSGSNLGGNQSCVISQTGPGSNNATCTEHTDAPTAVQSCSITQTGRSNVANVNQQNGSAAANESAKQTASVIQTGTGANGTNRATITQTIAQDASGALTLVQDGWARTDLSQLSSGTGTNTGNVTQRLTQNASGGTSQSQDTQDGTAGDCDPGQGPADPNLCANISQVGTGGDNSNSLFQKVIETGKTPRLATQTQGSGDGGLDGKVHQDTGPSATNYNGAYQHKIQTLTGGAGSTQKQYDPMFCCGVGSQDGGNSLNRESIGQGFSQQASQPGASQTGELIGTSRTPIGACSISQDASNNAASTTNSASEGPPSCPFLLLRTTCQNNSDGGGCTPFDPQTTPPGPSSQLVKSVRTIPIEAPPGPFAPTTQAGSGETVQYQIVYTNTGAGTAHDVVVEDTLPTEVELNEGSCTPEADCTTGTNDLSLTWTLGDVPAGGSVTMTFSGVYGPAGSCDNADNTANATDAEDESVNSNTSTVFDTDCIG